MSSRVVVLVVLLLTVGICRSAPGADATPEISFERYRLPNGLTVIFHRNDRLPIVAVNIWYYVGSKDEPPGRSGFAHLFEHLMFMGTNHVPLGEFDRVMELHGGSNNATTSTDRTNYFASGPSNLLEMFLFLESDRLRDLGKFMTREKLDLQREVVKNERRQNYEDRPYGKAFIEMWPLLFPAGHPYHHTVIGSHEDLSNATVSDVTEFFDKFYLPSNASLVIAGDFEPEKARKWVEKYFGDIPAGEPPEHATAEPAALDGPRLRVIEDRINLSRTMLLYHSPRFFADGDADMDVLATLLGDPKTGRLYRRLVYEKQMAQDVAAYQSSRQLGSVFVIQATARPGVSLESIEAEIDAVITELDTSPPTARECDRARNGFRVSFWKELESMHARADLLNRYQFFWGDPGAIKKDLARYDRATPDSVYQWSKKILRVDRRATLRVVPQNAATKEDEK